MALQWRVRLLGAAINRAVAPYARMSDVTRHRLNSRSGPRWVGEVLSGRPDPAASVAEVVVPGPAGGIPALTYRPVAGDGSLPLLVVLHGGGFVFGHRSMTAWLSSHLATRVGAVVVAPGYRLAPEFPAPAPGEDCYAVAAWAAEHAAELGGDAGRLAVVGESAGATLAAVVTLLARERGGPRVRAQGLAQGAYDLRPGSPMMIPQATWPFGRSTDAPDTVAAYLGATGDPEDALVSPQLADHTGLPPAFVLTADHDYLREDGERYAAALRAAGVRVEHLHLVDSPHGVFSFPGWCASAVPALDRLAAFLRRELAVLP